MLRRLHKDEDHNKLAEAIDTLARDGAADVTVEPLADLTLSEASYLRERWGTLADDLRHRIVTQMASLAGEDIRMSFERPLMIALSDANPDVRFEATQALWEVESTGLLTALLERLRKEPEVHVRIALVDALSRFAQRAIESDFEPDLRDETEELLVGVALNDQHEDVRLGALAAAAYFRPLEIQDEIARAYDEGHEEAREIALRAMGRFGGQRWAPRVLDGLAAGDEELREAAIIAAPYVEDRRVIPYLFEAAEDDDLPGLQLVAIQSLGDISGTNVQSFLEALKDSSTGDVSFAAEAALESAALLEGVDETTPIH